MTVQILFRPFKLREVPIISISAVLGITSRDISFCKILQYSFFDFVIYKASLQLAEGSCIHIQIHQVELHILSKLSTVVSYETQEDTSSFNVFKICADRRRLYGRWIMLVLTFGAVIGLTIARYAGSDELRSGVTLSRDTEPSKMLEKDLNSATCPCQVEPNSKLYPSRGSTV